MKWMTFIAGPYGPETRDENKNKNFFLFIAAVDKTFDEVVAFADFDRPNPIMGQKTNKRIKHTNT